jgi:AAA15 family ATPase/GTPase
MLLHKTYQKTLENLTIPIRTSFIVEEPEQNLFPYTQLQLLDAVAALCQNGRQHELFFTTHSPYIINYLNVMLRRSQEEGKPYISADDMMIQMVMEGKLQNLLAVDERNGERVVDTYDLSEPIETIFRQYKQLGDEVAAGK